MEHADWTKDVIVFLVAAGIIVPIFHRARIGAVLGFLVVGVVVGPYGLGRLTEQVSWIDFITIGDLPRVQPFAELGVIFLLFVLGVELSFTKLWTLRRYVFGVGASQMVLAAIVLGAAAAVSATTAVAAVLGLCLALSSTAVVMQILIEQKRSASQVGRVALSVLLFQDLMVVPVLFITGALGVGGALNAQHLILVIVQAAATVAAIMVVGYFVLRPLLRFVAQTGSRDLIMAITVLIIAGISGATAAAGLSYALGAFLAGLMFGETEYRHQIEIDLEPFKGLLLGVFFMTVGMSLDPFAVWANVGAILAGVVVLLTVKAAVMYAAARLFGLPSAVAAELALLLAQAGEFAFVVVGLARGSQLMPPKLATTVVAVVALSMMLTPLLALLARHVGRRLDHEDYAAHGARDGMVELEGHVVIGGFGRVGQLIARVLEREHVPFVAFDLDGATVTRERANGRMVFYGDASRRELLERTGGTKARAFVVTLDAPGAAERMVGEILKLRADACVIARAKDSTHAIRLIELGAAEVIPEATEASLQLAGRVLDQFDLPNDVVQRRLAIEREVELERLGGGRAY